MRTVAHRSETRHQQLLDLIHAGPPAAATDVFFNTDLDVLDAERLREEQRRLRLRLLLTPRDTRDQWPSVWIADRLVRCEALLRSETVVVGWDSVRR